MDWLGILAIIGGLVVVLGNLATAIASWRNLVTSLANAHALHDAAQTLKEVHAGVNGQAAALAAMTESRRIADVAAARAGGVEAERDRQEIKDDKAAGTGGVS